MTRATSDAAGWSRLFAGCACFFATASTAAGPAVGQFELKDLEAGAGTYEFQSQNAWSWDQPDRMVQDDGSGGFIVDENTVIQQRYAQELEMGLSDWLKMRVGLEFEKERTDDPDTLDEIDDFESLQLQELGMELIGILIPRAGDGWGLGVVTEIELPLVDDETTGFLVGPIFEFQSGPWFAAAVTAFVRSIGGAPDEPEDDKWDFSYASQLSYRFSDTWTLAIEGYGTIERIGSTGHRSESTRLFGDFNQHRAGPIVYFQFPLGGPSQAGAAHSAPLPGLGGTDEEQAEVSIGLGYFAGLNNNTPDHTLKLSIEVDY
jgi:hypothetical protein